MAATTYLKENFLLTLKLHFALIKPPRQIHHPIHTQGLCGCELYFNGVSALHTFAS
jgi:hypothetical protein